MSRYTSDMDRRTFLSTLGVAVLAAPLAATAQPAGKVPRVAVLFTATPIADLSGPNPMSLSMRGFLEGMRELGWVDGQNITIERRSALGHTDRYLALAQEMVNLKVDVMVISGAVPFVQAAQQATRTVPIVMAGLAGNPVTLKLANSFASPGGNVTGSTFTIGPGHWGKLLELLKEMAPRISRVAILHQPGRDLSDDAMTERAARTLGLTLLGTPIDASRGIVEPLAEIKQRQVNALLVEGGPAWGYHRQIIEFAETHRLPAIYVFRDFVKAGGLMSYGADYADIFRRSASYVDKILKGANPGDLPIEQPTKFELLINLKTAKALGLTVPPSLLLRADEIIK